MRKYAQRRVRCTGTGRSSNNELFRFNNNDNNNNVTSNGLADDAGIKEYYYASYIS